MFVFGIPFALFTNARLLGAGSLVIFVMSVGSDDLWVTDGQLIVAEEKVLSVYLVLAHAVVIGYTAFGVCKVWCQWWLLW